MTLHAGHGGVTALEELTVRTVVVLGHLEGLGGVAGRTAVAQLAAMGVVLKDSRDGTTWEIAR